MKSVLFAAVALAAAAVAGSASAELINNGHFKNGSTPAPGGFVDSVGVGSNLIPGWDVLAGNVDWITGYWAGSDGDGYSIDLNGREPGKIGQTISTINGMTYSLSFDIAANPDFGGPRVAIVGANGNVIGSETFNLGLHDPVVWSRRYLTFTADSNSTLITFESGTKDNCCYGAAIDNVSVGVPEPAAWALMIVGFGGVGATLRRRRQLPA
jgi:choice-of-anchor C domain-containing protein